MLISDGDADADADSTVRHQGRHTFVVLVARDAIALANAADAVNAAGAAGLTLAKPSGSIERMRRSKSWA
ncbi:hypothetical protein [Methylosinus sp. LW4]|uniref:hypothetical protein n=1 Tax=Methylosinus sp. LW4 TaxID=136993 RepID=UPI00036BEF7C|nr:hypothetical protein [Methylosinus sp. LW4]